MDAKNTVIYMFTKGLHHFKDFKTDLLLTNLFYRSILLCPQTHSVKQYPIISKTWTYMQANKLCSHLYEGLSYKLSIGY